MHRQAFHASVGVARERTDALVTLQPLSSRHIANRQNSPAVRLGGMKQYMQGRHPAPNLHATDGWVQLSSEASLGCAICDGNALVIATAAWTALRTSCPLLAGIKRTHTTHAAQHISKQHGRGWHEVETGVHQAGIRVLGF